MQALRWGIAVFITLNAVTGILMALRAVGLKRRTLVHVRPAVNALLASLSWSFVGFWLASMTLFLASAVLLVFSDPAATVTFLLALAVNLATVWKAHEEISGGDSRAGELLSRSLLFGLLFLGGQGIWPASPGPSHGARLGADQHADGGSRR
jgi:hypothetical protein